MSIFKLICQTQNNGFQPDFPNIIGCSANVSGTQFPHYKMRQLETAKYFGIFRQPLFKMEWNRIKILVYNSLKAIAFFMKLLFKYMHSFTYMHEVSI